MNYSGLVIKLSFKVYGMTSTGVVINQFEMETQYGACLGPKGCGGLVI